MFRIASYKIEGIFLDINNQTSLSPIFLEFTYRIINKTTHFHHLRIVKPADLNNYNINKQWYCLDKPSNKNECFSFKPLKK